MNGEQEERIHVYNMYNPLVCTGQSTIPLLRDVLVSASGENYIVVGDFNLHHFLWGGDMSLARDDEADELI
jgi:hypothetical protein